MKNSHNSHISRLSNLNWSTKMTPWRRQFQTRSSVWSSLEQRNWACIYNLNENVMKIWWNSFVSEWRNFKFSSWRRSCSSKSLSQWRLLDEDSLKHSRMRKRHKNIKLRNFCEKFCVHVFFFELIMTNGVQTFIIIFRTNSKIS